MMKPNEALLVEVGAAVMLRMMRDLVQGSITDAQWITKEELLNQLQRISEDSKLFPNGYGKANWEISPTDWNIAPLAENMTLPQLDTHIGLLERMIQRMKGKVSLC
jgi:hypothetical protein